MALKQRLTALPDVGAWPRWRIAWLGGVFIAAITALAIYDMVRGYQATVAETRRELGTQSRVIAEQTARGVQAVDVVLKHLADQLQRGTLSLADAQGLHLALKDEAAGLVQSDGVFAFGADGRLLAASQVPPQQMIDLAIAAERPFPALRDEPTGAGIVFGNVRVSPGSGRRIFPIARRVTDREGRFAGVVGAPGRVEYFQDFYRDSYPDPSTRISLVHRNGWLLARHPPADATLGKRLDVVDALLPPGGAVTHAVARLPSPVDGVDHFVALQTVPNYPLIVAVSRDAQVALAPWRSQTIGSAWRTLALGALAALLLAVVWHQLARVSAARASLAVSEQRYALAAAGSDVGVWDWDLAAGTAYESRRARELQGLPLEPETQPLDTVRGLLTYHPDDAVARALAMQAHLDGATAHYEVEYRVRRADGRYYWIHVHALCIRDTAGKPLRIAGSVSDIDARKRAEAALRQSEERYALAMTGSNEGHWLWDMAAHQIYVSAKQAELFCIEGGAQTLAAQDYFDRLPLHPDDRERVHHSRNEHVAGRTPRLDHEFRIVMPGTGEVRWLHTRAQCFRDADGRPLRLAGSTVDATQRKRAEEALRESQARFAVAVAGADDGIWEWDFVKGTAFGSSRGRELLGLPPGPEVQSLEAWKAEITAQIHPDDLPRRNAAIAEHLAGRSDAYVVDFRVRRREGQWRWMHTHGRCERDAEGKPLRMAGSASDIDARKRTEEALRESEERYALAMTGSKGGHWVWDSATGTTFASSTVNELFGLPPGAPPTRDDFLERVRFHPDDRARVLAVNDDLEAGRVDRADYEYRIFLPDGSERWILSRAQHFKHADGRGLRVAGVSVDVTERKQAELERQRLEEQLRQAQKLEAIGTLAGGIAHDFNNILSAILGYGELAQKSAAEGTPLRRHIDASIAAGQRAKSLVERILAFSRSGMGERVPVHVQSVVEEALDAVAGSLPPGVKLTRTLAAGDAGVLGDATQIHQVVMNLCANAVQAMKSAGALDVMLDVHTLAAPLAVATNTLPAGGYLRLAIADSGSGIAPELLARIFDPFFTTKEVGVGTGLGLSLVHGIVTDLGGGIAVESRVDAGSRFTVYLPTRTVVAAPVTDGPGPTEFGDGKVVLLVDDEEALVRLGEEALAEIGYEPVGFTSPTAALEALRTEPTRFDILLSDEAMPSLTGTELARAARALRPNLPVVLASGYVTAALQQRARAAGVAEVLSKPLATAEVARALAAALKSAAGGLNMMAK